MRFLEYYEIPGISIDNRFLFFQRLSASAKKAKLDHLASRARSSSKLPIRDPLFFPAEPYFYFYEATTDSSSSASVLPDHVSEDIRSIALQRFDPPPAALQAHIASLERELLNCEFQLQYLYNQRISTSELLSSAKRQLDKLSG